MKLSNQAIGAVMMALQKSLMDQSDIVPVLQGFNLVLDTETEEDEVIVSNPPIVKFDTGGGIILNDGEDEE
ncbi:MAG: hypothetical protein CL811_05760 [Colwelliaceae bacterium]|nr:hypothetical protein [Colwelliaceae bacterium]|tara:strand:- start:1191 stop:1403 length:213 start_codon:yes stop_codon:yes gene_type:complete